MPTDEPSDILLGKSPFINAVGTFGRLMTGVCECTPEGELLACGSEVAGIPGERATTNL